LADKGGDFNRQLLEDAGKALKALADKLKAKEDELDTNSFTVEKLSAPDGKEPGPWMKLSKVLAKAAKSKPERKAASDAKDPLAEPELEDPAADLPAAPAKTPKPKPAPAEVPEEPAG